MTMMRKVHITISLTARSDMTKNRSMVEITEKSSMAMSLVVKVVIMMKTAMAGDATMTSTTDRGQTDSMVGVGVLHHQGAVGSHQGGAVGRENVEEVEVVHVIAVVVTVAVVHRELDIEVVGADLLTDVIVVAVRLQTRCRDKSHHSVETTCQAKVTHPSNNLQ